MNAFLPLECGEHEQKGVLYTRGQDVQNPVSIPLQKSCRKDGIEKRPCQIFPKAVCWQQKEVQFPSSFLSFQSFAQTLELSLTFSVSMEFP
jgi:hypothetical protein